MKNTKIVATIGPATDDPESIREMVKRGVNVIRMNFSHGDLASKQETFDRLVEVNKTLPEQFAILLDTKGPEIRSADLEEDIKLTAGEKLILTIDDVKYEDTKKINVSYKEFINDVDVGDIILIEHGVVKLKALEKKGSDIICEVLNTGVLETKRHLTLPGKNVSLPSITEKDWEDIKFGVKNNYDYIALSFVRRAAEIEELREFYKSQNCNTKIIAKIETYEVTKYLDEVIAASDGVMVARGDLAAETSFPEVPGLQRKIVNMCNMMNKPVIVATDMLDSMIRNAVPTRAEVSDIAQAVWQGTDAVMLSGETAKGKFALEAVDMMTHTIQEAEKETDYCNYSVYNPAEINESDEFARVAAEISEVVEDISAIVVFTKSGYTAKRVSVYHPNAPIFVVTNDEQIQRQVKLFWGIKGTCKVEFANNDEEVRAKASKILVEKYPELSGRKFIVVGDFLVNGKFMPTVQVRNF